MPSPVLEAIMPRVPVVWFVVLALVFDLSSADARARRRGGKRRRNQVVAAPFPGKGKQRGRAARRGRGRQVFRENRRNLQNFRIDPSAFFGGIANPSLFQDQQVFPTSPSPLPQTTGAHGPTQSPNPGSPSPQPLSQPRPTNTAADFCSDLHSTICSTATKPEVFEATLEKNATDLLDRFAPKQAGGVERFVQMMGQVAESPEKARTQFKQPYANYLQFLNGALKTEVPDLDQTLETIGKSLTSAISKNPELSQKFPNSGALRFTRSRFITVPNPNNANELASFVEVCGPDGLIPNAAYDEKLDVVMACPGMILASRINSKGNTLSGLAHIFSHELGHSIDNVRKPGYEPLRACYSSLNSQDVGNIPLPNTNNADTLAEIVADQLGVESVSEILQTQNLKGARALEFLKGSAALLCSTPVEKPQGNGPEAPHPDPRFRINIILGRNPAIRESLGCARPSEISPACTLKGRTP